MRILSKHLVLLTLSIAVLSQGLRAESKKMPAGNELKDAEHQTYYINSETGNDSNAGTSTQLAWKSLKNVENTSFQAGDRLLFAKNSSFIGGTIFQSSGTAENAIVIGNYGEGALPSFSNPDGSWLFGNVFQITGSHIVIDGLSFAHCAASNVKYGPGMEERSREADARILQVGAIYTKVGADYITIKNCEFTDCPIGININGQHSLITHNILNGCNRFLCEPDWGPLGIVIGNAFNEVAYNTGSNHVAWGGNYGGDGGFIELDDRYSGGKVHDVKIHHNKSFDNMGFLEIESHVEGRNIDVYYNLSKDYQSFLLMWGVLGKIENNTVIRTLPGGWVIAIGKNRESSRTFTFRNNIFVIDDGLQVFQDNQEALCQIIHENNLYFSADSSTENPCGKPLGLGELIADPKFVDSANNDYNLSPESPAIGKGARLGYAFDIDKTPIPKKKAPSIGAFEYKCY